MEDSHFFLSASRRSQMMYSGTESTTNKEGATVFEVQVRKGGGRQERGKRRESRKQAQSGE